MLSKIKGDLLVLLWAVIQFLTWITLFVTLANSETDLSPNAWLNIGLHLFRILKWPTLFFYGQSYFPLFWILIGLSINSLIYAFILERLLGIVLLFVRKGNGQAA